MGETATVVIGTSVDNEMDGEMRVTIITTGIGLNNSNEFELKSNARYEETDEYYEKIGRIYSKKRDIIKKNTEEILIYEDITYDSKPKKQYLNYSEIPNFIFNKIKSFFY